MKKLFVCLFLLFCYSDILAQTKSELKAEAEAKKVRDKIYNSGDKDFDVTAIPANLNNEAAVIICQKLTQVFDKSGVDMVLSNSKSLATTETLRKRIKLLDKSAVETYSEFYFKNTNDVGVRIIKPDGKYTDVNMREAVEVDQNVRIPSIYKSYYSFSFKYKKLAIPDLQPGDIIDYFYTVKEEFFIPGMPYFTFNDVIISLANTYPTMKQKIEFKVEKQFYINIKSINGAPMLTPVAEKEGNFFVYNLDLTNSEKFYDEKWVYTYRSTPTIKYQVFFLRTANTSTNFAIGERGKPKTSITPDEAVDQITGIYNDATNYYVSAYIMEVNAYLSDKFGKENDPLKISHAVYYYLRGLVATPSVAISTPGYLDQPFQTVLTELSNVDTYGPGNEQMSDEFFTKVMAGVLKKKKINFRVAFGVSRYIGNLEDAILANEFIWAIYVEGSKPFFLFAPSASSHPNELDYRFEGIDAYIINLKPEKNAKKYEVKRVPVSSPTENNTLEKLDVIFDESMEIATIDKITSVKGKNKDGYYESTIIKGDYAEAELKKYGLKPKYIYKGKKDKMEIINKAVITAKEEADKKRSENQKTELEDEGFEIGKYESFNIINDGRQPGQDKLEFKEKFQVKNLINKAGTTYIIESGKLIGGTVQIKDNEITRYYDIYMSTPRSFSCEIAINIPSGYKAEGIEKLNMNLDNATGKFTSTSKIEGGKIIISVNKIYKNNFEKKESWPEMVKYLDEAYKFSQSKIVLKKA